MPSTVIRSMYYRPSAKRLRIEYVSGNIYEYQNVPQEEYDAMRAAASKGTYLNQNIKGKYAFEKMDK